MVSRLPPNASGGSEPPHSPNVVLSPSTSRSHPSDLDIRDDLGHCLGGSGGGRDDVASTAIRQARFRPASLQQGSMSKTPATLDLRRK